MRAWKGVAGLYSGVACTPGPEGPPNGIPVLVIDASDFPKDYPEIGSEWLRNDDKVSIESHPIFSDFRHKWQVLYKHSDGAIGIGDIDGLNPIPTEVTGEVVGTLTLKVVGVDEDADHITITDNPLTIEWSPKMPPVPAGTYDIVRRK